MAPQNSEKKVSGSFESYQVARQFKDDSRLHAYLAAKCPSMISAIQKDYTLYDVLLALRMVISQECLYDQSNPTVVICGDDLEGALGMKALHVTEIKDQVCKQLMPISASGNDQSTSSSPSAEGCCVKNTVIQLESTGHPSASLSHATPSSFAAFDPNSFYWVKPNFLRVIQQVSGVDPKRQVFTYKELTSYLSQYILDNKSKLFDDRNIKVAFCDGDLLGDAFGVKVFHRTQVTGLLRSQLVPLKNGEIPGNVVDGGRSTRRKRMSSSSETEGNIVSSDLGAKRKRSGKISVTLELGYSSGEETIYSAQGYETDVVRDDASVGVASSSDESRVASQAAAMADRAAEDTGGETDDVYRVEYEVESDTEVEEEDDEGGGKRDNALVDTTTDNSDLEDVVLLASAVHMLKDDTDIADWADSSDSEVTQEGYPCHLGFQEDKDQQRPDKLCLNCRLPIQHMGIQYCAKCWQDRKGWVPDRPKPRKRKCKRTKGMAVKGRRRTKKQIYVDVVKREESGESSCGDLPSGVTGDDNQIVITICSDDPNTSPPAISNPCLLYECAGEEERKSIWDSGIGSCSSQEVDEVSNNAAETTKKLVDEDKRKTTKKGCVQNLIECLVAHVGDDGLKDKLELFSTTVGLEKKNCWRHHRCRSTEDEVASYPPVSLIEPPLSICSMCCERPKDACFVHGKISHQVSCYPCAKKLYRKKKSCPLCRRKIEKITKNVIG